MGGHKHVHMYHFKVLQRLDELDNYSQTVMFERRLET